MPELTISEKDFQNQIIKLATICGWKVHRNWTEMHSPKGWPDIVAARLSRLIIAELKSDKGKVTPEQQEWLDLLYGTGKVEVFVWRPNNFEEIVEILR